MGVQYLGAKVDDVMRDGVGSDAEARCMRTKTNGRQMMCNCIEGIKIQVRYMHVHTGADQSGMAKEITQLRVGHRPSWSLQLARTNHGRCLWKSCTEVYSPSVGRDVAAASVAIDRIAVRTAMRFNGRGVFGFKASIQLRLLLCDLWCPHFYDGQNVGAAIKTSEEIWHLPVTI